MSSYLRSSVCAALLFVTRGSPLLGALVPCVNIHRDRDTATRRLDASVGDGWRCCDYSTARLVSRRCACSRRPPPAPVLDVVLLCIRHGSLARSLADGRGPSKPPARGAWSGEVESRKQMRQTDASLPFLRYLLSWSFASRFCLTLKGEFVHATQSHLAFAGDIFARVHCLKSALGNCLAPLPTMCAFEFEGEGSSCGGEFRWPSLARARTRARAQRTVASIESCHCGAGPSAETPIRFSICEIADSSAGPPSTPSYNTIVKFMRVPEE